MILFEGKGEIKPYSRASLFPWMGQGVPRTPFLSGSVPAAPSGAGDTLLEDGPGHATELVQRLPFAGLRGAACRQDHVVIAQSQEEG
jgi:hypothetical protein